MGLGDAAGEKPDPRQDHPEYRQQDQAVGRLSHIPFHGLSPSFLF
jgi:hypothetical protein